jgi:uncharacterized membrane protein
MNREPMGIGPALSLGWSVFKKHAGVGIGGYLIYCAISFAGNMIPFVNAIFGLFVQPVFVGGFMILLLNMAKDANPTIGDLFEGFKRYWTWVGVTWLYIAIVAVSAIPLGIAALITFLILEPMQRGGYGSGLSSVEILMQITMGLGIAVSLVILFVLTMRWIFVCYLAAEGAFAVEAFKRSAEMTEGIRLKLFGISLVLGLFGWAGVIGCGVGALLTGLVSSLAFAFIYLGLKPRETLVFEEAPPAQQ